MAVSVTSCSTPRGVVSPSSAASHSRASVPRRCSSCSRVPSRKAPLRAALSDGTSSTSQEPPDPQHGQTGSAKRYHRRADGQERGDPGLLLTHNHLVPEVLLARTQV